MRLNNTTAVPNVFFDELMKDLSASAVRVYLKIVRNTNGWRDANGYTKQRDWISHSQFGNVGVSSRSVTSAVDELLSYGLIHLTDEQGNNLHEAQKRKRAKRIYYGLTEQTKVEPTTIIAKSTYNNAKNDKTKVRNLRTTKEIFLQNSSQQNNHQRTPDHIRIQQIKEEQQRKQIQRDSWL